MNDFVLVLEEQLAGDPRGELRDEIIKRFVKERTSIRQRIDVGLTVEEFQTAKSVHDAYAAAERVVNYFWASVHVKRTTVFD